ncbi:MAG: GYD domain-containing protein [Chloroflexi bacterium]|nr:GYD domain-containing protein [Chloroflexota bacterium]
MPTYITLATLTDQGVRTMKDLPQRIENAEKTFNQMGAQLRDIYLVMGVYDYVVVAEAPDETTMARIALAVAGQGNVRTQTFRAFERSEMFALVEDLP